MRQLLDLSPGPCGRASVTLSHDPPPRVRLEKKPRPADRSACRPESLGSIPRPPLFPSGLASLRGLDSFANSPPSSVGKAQGPQPCGRGFEPHGGCFVFPPKPMPESRGQACGPLSPTGGPFARLARLHCTQEGGVRVSRMLHEDH